MCLNVHFKHETTSPHDVHDEKIKKLLSHRKCQRLFSLVDVFIILFSLFFVIFYYYHGDFSGTRIPQDFKTKAQRDTFYVINVI